MNPLYIAFFSPCFMLLSLSGLSSYIFGSRNIFLRFPCIHDVFSRQRDVFPLIRKFRLFLPTPSILSLILFQCDIIFLPSTSSRWIPVDFTNRLIRSFTETPLSMLSATHRTIFYSESIYSGEIRLEPDSIFLFTRLSTSTYSLAGRALAYPLSTIYYLSSGKLEY